MDSFIQFDGNLLIGIQHALNADWLTPIMKVITLFGEAGVFWISLCLAMLLFRKTRRLGIICAFSLLLTFISCNLIIKPAVDRVRPWVTFQLVNAMLPPPCDASFPSGHSISSFASAMVIALMLGKRYGVPAFIGAFVIAFSRLFHGTCVGYVSDNFASKGCRRPEL